MASTSKPFLAIRTEQLHPEAEQWLAERCELITANPDDPEFESRAEDIAALVIRTYTIVDGKLLDRLPALKVVGRAGVGVDNIDLPECAKRGVRVVYTPDANTQAVVEYVTCLLCDALRPRVELEGLVSKEEWTSLRSTVCGERQMNECTLGILGFGRIGSRLAHVASAIGFRVLYNDLLEIPESSRNGAEPVSLEELFSQSDVLSVHIDGRESNHGFLDAARYRLMKDDAILLNTSRGFVLDESDLAAWLSEHPRALAVLDVHAKEPFGADAPLLRSPNARLMPHLASRTRTAMINMSWVVKDVWRVLQGEDPEHDAIRDLLPATAT